MIKRNKNKVYFLLYLIIAISFFAILINLGACTSAPKPPDCINKTALNSELSWGKLINDKQVENYTLLMTGELIETKIGKDIIEKEINPDSLCIILQTMGQLIIEVQTLNVPADTSNYMIYKNVESGYYFRALWNPLFENEGNTKFIEFYNRLIKLAEAEK
jgi:hypothetical protein